MGQWHSHNCDLHCSLANLLQSTLLRNNDITLIRKLISFLFVLRSPYFDFETDVLEIIGRNVIDNITRFFLRLVSWLMFSFIISLSTLLNLIITLSLMIHSSSKTVQNMYICISRNVIRKARLYQTWVNSRHIWFKNKRFARIQYRLYSSHNLQ